MANIIFRKNGTNYTIDGLIAGTGHIIKNSSGQEVNARQYLQFNGAYLGDDSVGDATQVNVVRTMTQAQFNNLTADEQKGFIYISDAAGQLTASEVALAAIAGMSATTVQSGISELNSDKVEKSGDTMTGRLTISSTGANDWSPLIVQSNYANICFVRLYDKNGAGLGDFGCNEANFPVFRNTYGNLAPIFAPTTFTNTSFTPTNNTRTTLYTNTSGHTQIVFCSVSAEVRSATGIIYLNKNNDGSNPLATASLSAVDVSNPQYQHVTLTCFVQLANGDAIKYYPVTGSGTLGSHSVTLAY